MDAGFARSGEGNLSVSVLWREDATTNPAMLVDLGQLDAEGDPLVAIAVTPGTEGVRLSLSEARALAAALAAWADRVVPVDPNGPIRLARASRDELLEQLTREQIKSEGLTRERDDARAKVAELARPATAMSPWAALVARMDRLESVHQGVLSTLRDFEADVSRIRQGLRAGGA